MATQETNNINNTVEHDICFVAKDDGILYVATQ